MSGDELIIALVILSRFGVPLLIPRFPLPAIAAALVLDAVDGTILEKLTGSEPPGYQGYDKALDIYYLAVAYVSTMRNWRHLTAFHTSRVLFYLRLVGVAAFEISGARWLLIVFPNVFEYFFIWYEALRIRWNPMKFTAAHVLVAAAAIWVFIKLPQEWFVHIAQLDFTDTMSNHPWLWGVMAVGVVILEVLRRRYVRFLGPGDWSTTFAVDKHLARQPLPKERPVEKIFSWTLVEKIALASLVSIIFLKVLELQASAAELAVAVTVVVITNSTLTHWMSRHGHTWRWLTLEFLVMAVVNFGALLIYIGLRSSFDAELETGAAFFNVAVFTLILTLFDRYRRMGSALEHGAALELRRLRQSA
jgi:hypothetical protein